MPQARQKHTNLNQLDNTIPASLWKQHWCTEKFTTLKLASDLQRLWTVKGHFYVSVLFSVGGSEICLSFFSEAVLKFYTFSP